MPEIWLVLGMCAVILVPFLKRTSVALPTGAALAALFFALAATTYTLVGDSGGTAVLGTLTIDPFSQFVKLIVILFAILVIAQWIITTRGQTAAGDTPDFLCLLLGAALGMSLMSSASNLLMIFVAMESASYPSYALAGFRKRHRIGTEGSLKYVVFGSAASAIMVYGMSLVYGMTGTLNLSDIASQIAGLSHTSSAVTGTTPALAAIGLLLIFAGVAFKLSAVPMHFWCPDVFQGAPFEVTTFLSVASKGAAVALLVRLLFTLGAASPVNSGLFTGVGVGVAILGAATATWGNLVALHQTNIKRLLAYSSISHAGYMIMACSLIALAPNTATAHTAITAVLFYLVVYMFMNLGAFTVGAAIAAQQNTEDIREYAGMSKRSPILAALMTVFLLSLFGMPGLGGFMGKVFLMQAMSDAGPAGFVLIAVLLINTLLSLAYYVKPAYYMYFTADKESRPTIFPSPAALLMLFVCAAALFWTGLLANKANSFAGAHAVLMQPANAAAAAPTLINGLPTVAVPIVDRHD
ncbi:MAG: NADH-quinone oxidoreductase subunit N [Planctomycetes bacterium]|nr:NADH-quinone oxidoreductase subunit N [Planctomycetota bacterium]